MTINGHHQWQDSREGALRSGVPKVLGADVELANFILGLHTPGGSGPEASRRLLDAIPGIGSRACATATAIDQGRKYLSSNGGCAYIDSDHLEVALCETLSAYDHVAHWRAMLAVARRAMRRVNEELPEGYRLQILANCSDGLGNSYGSHVNVLLTREAWNDIFSRKTHYLAYLAAFQISSIVFTGQGKVGSERDRPWADFQLSQRADFMETLANNDTMVFRGVVNTRDEPHAGLASHAAQPPLARLHVIFFDSTLCQVATLLRVGTLQMIAAMLEAGYVDANLALEDPLEALGTWSRDPTLSARAGMVNGGSRTAVELQLEFLTAAKRFAARGSFDAIVPEADRLLELWEDTLLKLEARDFDALSRRLDWVVKRRLLRSVLASRPDLTWRSPAVKQLDQLYASLDEADGPFWALERAGELDRVVSDETIARADCEPPDDTRAWTRAQLLRLAGDAHIDQVDWDRIRLSTKRPGSWIPSTRTVHMPLPFGATRAINERHFIDNVPLEAVLDALRAADDDMSSAAVRVPPPTVWTVRTGGDQ
jgi:Pup amidohydrolase